MSEQVIATAGDLPDVNVWLALAVKEHVHHEAAVAYWRQAAEVASHWRYFCRVSSLSLVRLLAHPRVMANKELSLSAAWSVYRRFAELPGVRMLDEPAPAVDRQLGIFASRTLPSRHFTDAYFAALAACARLRVVTFDRDFERFAGVIVLRLSADA
jgi:toxin-antitoxin system PIN domain toxin